MTASGPSPASSCAPATGAEGSPYALARAAVDHARGRGARALEAYPILTTPGQKISWDEIHVGTPGIFAAAGLAEINRPTKRRTVMRIDF